MSHAAYLVPADTTRAAKRAFIRTLAQGYESALAGLVVSAAAILGFLDAPDTRTIVVTAVVWLATPWVGATRAYLSILRDGIPEDYAPDLDTGQRVPSSVDPD